MYQTIRPLLFRLDPEQAHRLTIGLIRLAGNTPGVPKLLRRLYPAPVRPVQAFGLTFQNPVGLAAGYDKDGLGWRGLACLGFGHIEVGTVTPRPQPGNPTPRVFRLPEARAIINRMGFPGRGAQALVRALSSPRPSGLVLGVNLGKNKDTPLEEAAHDYLSLTQTFAPLADYLAINVSSPNTIGLRRLQARKELEALLIAIVEVRSQQANSLNRPVPILVKLAPDLDDAELDDALEAVSQSGVDGVIATNTTISRTALAGISGPAARIAQQTGGLSGAPLRQVSTEMIRKIARRTGGSLPIIGVGGILSVDDAKEKLDAGAVLVQIYTGLIYAGPGLASQIVTSLGHSANRANSEHMVE
jgi:dihydroorotate dehydrogenase